MFRRKLIAEFSGPDEIFAAGKAILTHPSIYGAIVRDAVDFDAQEAISAVTDYHNLPTTEDHAAAVIHEQLPAFKKLDPYTELWLSKQSLGPYLKLRKRATNGLAIGPFGAGKKVGSTPDHYDSIDSLLPYNDKGIIAGPLTFSVRVDPHEYISRHFRLSRARQDTLYLANNRLEMPRKPRDGLVTASVEQKLGDMVIIANHPRPSKHGVREGEPDICYAESTKVLLLSYYMDVQHPEAPDKQ
jgi:hypothetical protein